jgi:hypothetical protein
MKENARSFTDILGLFTVQVPSDWSIYATAAEQGSPNPAAMDPVHLNEYVYIYQPGAEGARLNTLQIRARLAPFLERDLAIGGVGRDFHGFRTLFHCDPSGRISLNFGTDAVHFAISRPEHVCVETNRVINAILESFKVSALVGQSTPERLELPKEERQLMWPVPARILGGRSTSHRR